MNFSRLLNALIGIAVISIALAGCGEETSPDDTTTESQTLTQEYEETNTIVESVIDGDGLVYSELLDADDREILGTGVWEPGSAAYEVKIDGEVEKLAWMEAVELQPEAKLELAAEGLQDVYGSGDTQQQSDCDTTTSSAQKYSCTCEPGCPFGWDDCHHNENHFCREGCEDDDNVSFR